MHPSLNHGPQLFELMGITGGGSADADSRAQTLTAHATPGTNGAWSEMIATTSFDYEGLYWNVCRTHPAASTRFLLDIGIGPSTAEQVVIADFPILEQSTSGHVGVCGFLPIRIPAGVRVAARIHRASTASAAFDFQLIGCGESHRGIPPFNRATTYGTDLANYRGTLVDPGASANTRGTRAELVASTTNPIRALYVVATRAATGGSNTTNNGAMLEISVGGSGTEVILIPPLCFSMNATRDYYMPHCFGPFFVNLPAGVRLSAVAQADFTLANARELAVSIVGFD